MWPYTETEYDWTSSHAKHFDAGEPITPTPEMIEFYIKRGHSMRAMALRGFAIEAWTALSRLVSRSRRKAEKAVQPGNRLAHN
jgi:hypothetical protein